MRVVVATPLTEDLCDAIVTQEPRVDLVYRPDLLPPMRWTGDHEGDPQFRRTAHQQAEFEALVDSAQALYGIPDSDPTALARTIAQNTELRWVHTMAAGGGSQVKAAGLDEADLTRIIFTTSAGPHRDALAEFALFGVLCGVKNLPRLLRDQHSRHWGDRWMMGHVHTMTVLVVGLGAIGSAVASRFAALGAQVIAVNRTIKKVAGVSHVYLPEEIESAASRSDAIVNTAPATQRTQRMIGWQVLSRLKPNAIFVNVGRGSVVDEAELIRCLDDGRLAFAALDVFDVEPLPQNSPLWRMPNVLISPHTAALDPAEDRLIADLFAHNATALLEGTAMQNVVNTIDFY